MSSAQWKLGLSVCAAAVAVSLLGCMDSPRNRQKLDTPSQTFKFSGQVVNPGETVKMTVMDQSDGSWDTNVTTTAATKGTSDGTFTWFAFNADAKLPFGPTKPSWKYWRKTTTASGSQRRIAADIAGYSTNQGDLHTFDLDADACMQQQTTGQGVINNCRSANSPIATVVANCGKSSQVCCLANEINCGKRCDHGHNCNLDTNLCTTPSGTKGLRCNGDATCAPGLACFHDTCVDSIENTPIIAMHLQVHTCDQANAQTKSNKFVVVDTGTPFFLDHPGSDTGFPGSTDTWGISVPGVKALGDLRGIALRLAGSTADQRDGWCFDRATLVVNGTTVFTKDFPGGVVLDLDNGVVDQIVASDLELRNAFAGLDHARTCGLPSLISFNTLGRTVEGVMGNVFVQANLGMRSVGASRVYWGDDGGARVTKVDENTVSIVTKFRADKDAAIFTIDGHARANIRLKFTSNEDRAEAIPVADGYVLKNCSASFGVDVTADAQFDAKSILWDVFDEVFSGLGEDGLQSALDSQLNNFTTFGDVERAQQALCVLNTASFPICDDLGKVCGAPVITIKGDSGLIDFDWSRMGPYTVDVAGALAQLMPMCHDDHLNEPTLDCPYGGDI